jgi:hypothetical protein
MWLVILGSTLRPSYADQWFETAVAELNSTFILGLIQGFTFGNTNQSGLSLERLSIHLLSA